MRKLYTNLHYRLQYKKHEIHRFPVVMWEWPNKYVMTHASLLGENIEKKSFLNVHCV